MTRARDGSGLRKGLRGKLLAVSAASVIAALTVGAAAGGAIDSGAAPSFTVTTVDGKTFTLGAQRCKALKRVRSARADSALPKPAALGARGVPEATIADVADQVANRSRSR